MAGIRGRAGVLASVAIIGVGVLALPLSIVSVAGAAALSEDEALLITVDSEEFEALAESESFDVIAATADDVVILGDAAVEEQLEHADITPVSVETYGTSLAAAAAAPAAPAALATTPYPLPEKLSGTSYETYFGGYRTQEAYNQYANDIAEAYPELVQLVDFGDSWLKEQGRGGNDLIALRITGDVAEQPAYDDGQNGKPRFVLVAQAHAREIITSEIAWRYAAELLNGYGTDPQITSLLDSTEVWINFRNNPDGAELVETALSDPALRLTAAGDANPVNQSKAWQRKNVNDAEFAPTSTNWSSQQPGVDLNRNWSFHWGEASSSTNPNAASYRGTQPHSEPEISATADLLTGLYGEYKAENNNPAPDSRQGTYVNLHSYSNYVIYPYAYDANANVPNLEPIKANAFRQSFVNGFSTGKAGEILYDNSGNDIDWIYSQLGVPAFTWEIGTAQNGGFFPNYTRVEDFYANVAPGIRFAAEASYLPYQASLGGVVEEVSTGRDGHGNITVTGNATDTVFGNDPASAQRRPAVTDISEVQAVLAHDRNALDEAQAVALTIDGGAAPTVDFAGTIEVTAANVDDTAVFVRAKNGSGQWGPWQSQFVDELELGAPAKLELTASSTTPVQGGTIEITALASDQWQRSLGDVSDQIILSSSVSSDIIRGNRVTFPHASPHLLTATLDGVTATINIEVTPAAVSGNDADNNVDDDPNATTVNNRIADESLERTGGAAPFALALLALLLLGGGAALVSRKLQRDQG